MTFRLCVFVSLCLCVPFFVFRFFNLFARAKLRRIIDANTSYDTLRCTYDTLRCSYVQLDALMRALGCLNGVEILQECQ